MTLAKKVLDLAIQIQQIASPTFAEGPRGEFIRDLFIQEKLDDVSMDSLGNVYARLPGKQKKARALIVSAHLDTVFPAGTKLQIKEEAGKVFGPGIGDNSIGVAALFGILWGIRERKIELKHDVWFVANVGEEGLGDLRGMRGVVERFGNDELGYLVLEGLALGHVYHRAIGVRRYRITAKTRGGHSWSDYGQPSAVHELAAMVTQLTQVRLPREPRTTMNVGTIHGGTGVNVLAAEAKCELDLRSEDPVVLAKIVSQVEDIILHWNHEGVKIQAEIIGERPAGQVASDHPLVKLAVESLNAQGMEAILTTGSTDANVPLSKGIPALVMGITTGGGAHTMGEYIDTEPIERGMESLIRFVELS
ncbi:MAG TPA: M20/M25/M40 family metallo-hydrolase [Anaerolineales bacterium]|nr:M20/M25/M40 family metallo-hydrolase [Anaerolineales bacterium]HNB39969.1 M20/M25/M40 family metallo-hydrolase [Anaerolineales bacterium]HNE02948.1 M20/M25/M40 family metallo-hydrolase [Anaerolineales bacterium]HNF93076.1 M20/M25/M40 family metallo-hydrolase [Anaerolineales bacterium]HNH26148.1 M20/M25/M40 family metallo-hydrolase [Anaerolineales bacterium]